MAAFDDWGPGTAGAEHNDPNLNHEQFQPVKVKAITPEEHAGHVANIVNSVQAATPSERVAGTRFYPRAHRDAVRVGLGMNPGMQPYDSASRRVGKTPLRKATPEQQEAFWDPKKRAEAATRGAGAIAALSPSSPAGMDWEHNPTAAHEVWGLTTEHMSRFHTADEASQKASKAQGALRTAKRSGEGVRDAQRAMESTKADYAAASEAARPALDESIGLRHAGNKAIIRAHSILSGEKTPEEELPMGQKTGHFYRNITGDPDSVTVDGRSHDLTIGKHLPWDTNRQLRAQGRYNYFADSHREARDQLGMRSASAVQATSWIQDKNAMLAKATPGLRAIGKAGNSQVNGRND